MCWLVACGPSQPPRGEHYTPVNSPEPPTACAAQRDAAKAAREEQLGDSTAAARARVAKAVLVHAECEIEHLHGAAIPPGSQQAVMVEIRLLRDAFQTAATLLEETRRYGDPSTTARAWLRSGDLHREYARKLRAAPGPIDLQPPQRAAFRAELAELAIELDKLAALAYVGAVDSSEEPEESEMLHAACAALGELDPDARSRRAACGRR